MQKAPAEELTEELTAEPAPTPAAIDESVGLEFSVERLQAARDKTLQVILETAARVKVGLSEQEIKQELATIQTRMGAPKSWHPPQIRIGANTLLPFGAKGLIDTRLEANDIFFIDIGPIFDSHEGDVGRSFVIGHDPEMKKCTEDVVTIWQEVREHWLNSQVTGNKLYEFAAERAQSYGWLLTREEANGHRIADFPHAARKRGSIEGWQSSPAANRWILEIQIRHPSRAFGAFYEDLLN